ncbi:MAG: hypothetical protein ACRDQ7_22535 [Haloechinothrix sp.]
MQPVECQICETSVLVEKNSLAHTSIQWTSIAGSSCTEFAAMVAEGSDSALIPTCVHLRDSIERAVADGALDVLDAPLRSGHAGR